MAYQYSTDDIIDALKATNGLISLAAKRLGCCSQTIYNRASRVQKVQDTIDACRDELVDLGELALRSAVVGKEPWAVSLVLKTLGRHRGYVGRQEQALEHSGDLGVRVIAIGGVDPDEDI
jgi:hypothetical protein